MSVMSKRPDAYNAGPDRAFLSEVTADERPCPSASRTESCVKEQRILDTAADPGLLGEWVCRGRLDGR